MDIPSLPLYTVVTSGQNYKEGRAPIDKDAKLVRQTENNTTAHLTPMFYHWYSDLFCQGQTVQATLSQKKTEQTSKVTGVATTARIGL